MNGIDRIRHSFESRKEIKLMTHVVGGYPSLSLSEKTVAAMASAGADLVEIQIPYSDPTADGPSIMTANTKARLAGTTTDAVIDMAGRLAASTGIPILLMSYINPVFRYGVERFIARAVELGISGMIIPDYPSGDELEIIKKSNSAGIAFVPLVTGGSSAERIKEVCGVSDSPFLYAVLRAGVTGRKTEITDGHSGFLDMAHRVTGKYVAAGFGIREKIQVETLSGSAHCAIIGSAITDIIERESAAGKDPAAAVAEFIRRIR